MEVDLLIRSRALYKRLLRRECRIVIFRGPSIEVDSQIKSRGALCHRRLWRQYRMIDIFRALSKEVDSQIKSRALYQMLLRRGRSRGAGQRQ